MSSNEKHNTNIPILIVGLPRSGTTWIGEVLASAHGTEYVYEPDNERRSALAWLYKSELHRFPYLTTNDHATHYETMWRVILTGNSSVRLANRALRFFLKKNAHRLEALIGEKSGFSYIDQSLRNVGPIDVAQPYTTASNPFLAASVRFLATRKIYPTRQRRIVAKSVHAALSMEWISAHFPIEIVLVLRNPYSLYASYKRMRMPDGYRNLLFQETLQRDTQKFIPNFRRLQLPEAGDAIAFQIMLMYKIIESQLTAHPEWTLVSHDRLCITPHQGYQNLFNRLHLVWSDRTRDKIDALNQDGKDFNPRRVSSQEPIKWKREMTSTDQDVIQRWIDRFDLHNFLERFISIA